MIAQHPAPNLPIADPPLGEFVRCGTFASALLLVGAGIARLASAFVTGTSRAYAKGLHATPPWLLVSAAGCLSLVAVVALAYRYQPASSRVFAAGCLDFFVSRPTKGSTWLVLTFFCAALVSVFDGDKLLHGFYRIDDLAILQVARTLPLGAQVWLPHGEHAMPLFRVEVTALVRAFGVDPLAFNVCTLGVFVSVLLAGCWLLAELGGRVISLLIFAVALWTWPGWSLCNYTFTVYPQSVACGFVAIAALVRAMRTGRARWLAVSFIALTFAALIDLAGSWAMVALAAFGLALSDSPARRVLRIFWWSLAAVTGGVVLVDAAIFHAGGFLGEPRDSGSTISGLTHSFVSGLAGLPLSWILNYGIAFLRAPAYRNVVELGSLLTLVGGGWWIYRCATAARRRIWLAIAASLAVGVAMAVAARAPTAAGWAWQPKWINIPVAWFALGLGFGFDRLFPDEPTAARRAAVRSLVALAAGIWLSFSLAALAVATDIPLGRLQSERRDRARRAEFNRLAADLDRLRAVLPARPIPLPEVSGPQMLKHYPALDGYRLSETLAAYGPSGEFLVGGNVWVSPDLRTALRATPGLEQTLLEATTTPAISTP